MGDVVQTDIPGDRPKDSAPVHGVLAEFDGVEPLIKACQDVRDQGYTVWDAHTPFPVHGLDRAMGVRPTRLPWLVLVAGVVGLGSALLLQWWTNAWDYPVRISGKPIFSLPANIPIAFELTVLFSAFAAFFGTLALNKLPALFHPLLTRPRFRQVTSDRFFVYVETQDPVFNQAALLEIFHSCHATAIEEVRWDAHGPETRLPYAFKVGVALLGVISLVPLALIARARESRSELPRIHVIPDDMDKQYKFNPQASNWLFEDKRAMRMPVEGTVAVGELEDKPVLDAEIRPTEAHMQRGRERFEVFCSPCHGLSGHGDGMVAKRAEALQEGTWIPPTSLHEERIRKQPVGELLHTITYGIRTMPGYGSQIDRKDILNIIWYLRALQLSQNAPQDAVPPELLPTLQ